MLLAAAYVAYRRHSLQGEEEHQQQRPTSLDTANDGWLEQVSRQALQSPPVQQALRCFGKEEEEEGLEVYEVGMRSFVQSPASAAGCCTACVPDDEDDEASSTVASTFRDDVRSAWLEAVFGEDRTHPAVGTIRRGTGLANMGTYTVTTQAVRSPVATRKSPLGLYVRTVTRGSEAHCAGVLPCSLLLAYNGVPLLGESSKSALERVWGYERAAKSGPVHWTLMRDRKVYSVVLVSAPPHGVTWAPCGSFDVATANPNVPRGCIVLRQQHQQQQQHRECVATLAVPPPASRARRSPPVRSKSASADLEGVRVRVHPFLSTPTASRNKRGRGSLLAHRVANGAEYDEKMLRGKASMQWTAVTPGMPGTPPPPSSGVYCLDRPAAPPALPSLARVWPLLECLRYCAQYHLSGYDEQKLAQVSSVDRSIEGVLDVMRPCTDQYWVGPFLLQLYNRYCEKSEVLDAIVSLARSDDALARRMELMAPSFGCNVALLENLRELRCEPIGLVPCLSTCSSIPPPPPPLSVTEDEDEEPVVMVRGNVLPPSHQQRIRVVRSTLHKTTTSRKHGIFGKLFRKHKKSLKRYDTTSGSTTDASTQQDDPAATTLSMQSQLVSEFDDEEEGSEHDQSEHDEVAGSHHAQHLSSMTKSSLFDDDDKHVLSVVSADRKVESEQQKRVLFSNTCHFVSELSRTVTTKPSLSQKLTGWMAHEGQDRRHRQHHEQQQQQPLWNPLDGSVLTRLHPEQCFLLPSAHVPLLLAFECPRTSRRCAERRYRVRVELLDLRWSPTSGRRRICVDDSRTYVVDGTIGDCAQTSGESTSKSVEQFAWEEGKGSMSFECQRSFGAPSTLSLRISQPSTGMDISSAIVPMNIDASENLRCDDVGFGWVDLTSMWEDMDAESMKSKTITCRAYVHSGPAIDQLEGPDNENLIVEEKQPELALRVTAEVDDVCDPLSGSPIGKRSLLFKHDEDLRQEMFATQFIGSCDDILRSCGLDLRLLTFRCLPVGDRQGFIEWVSGSVPLSEVCEPNSESSVLTKYVSLSQSRSNPIQDYFRSVAFYPDHPFMIRKDVMDAYVKSCAGYCVITYLLGVGDRHLDNLLLHEDGHLFHCDFSFIFGEDPKKYLPMRITETMVWGMGGRESDNFAKFSSLACAAFLTLRRPENARFLMSLVRIMWDDESTASNLSHSAGSSRLDDALRFVRDRFRLDLDDRGAMSYVEKLIDDSMSSKMWMAVDAIHSLGKRF